MGMGPGCDAAVTSPMGDADSKLEAVKGMLMQLVQMLGGDDDAATDEPSKIIEPGPNSEEPGDDAQAASFAGAAQDPKAKMLAMLKAKMQGGVPA